MAFFQAAAIGLIALIIAPGWLFYFDVTPKIAILLLAAAAAMFCSGRAPRWFSILVLASLLSLTVSSALSANPGLSFFGTNWRRFGAVTQAAVLLFAWSIARHTAGRLDRVRTILRGVSLATGVAAVYGIAQYFGWDPILPSTAYHVGEGVWTIVRPPGTLGYVSYFATWLVMAVFLGMAMASLETDNAWRAVAIGSAAAAALAMVLTGTRAGLLAIAVGGLVWLYHRGFRGTRRLAAGAGILLVAGVAFYFSPPGWKLRSRARWFVEDPWGGARIALWHDSLRMASQRLPLGYGPEQYTAAFPVYQSKELASAYPDFLHESPHNIFIDALISQGLAGALLLAAFCWWGFRAAFRAKSPWLGAALAAGIVSQQFTVFTAPTAMLLYAIVALAAGLGSAPASPRRNLFLAPLAAALAFCALRLTLADHALALAKRSVDSGDAAAAASHYERYTRWRFPGSSADLWYSRSLMDLAQRTTDAVARLRILIQANTIAEAAARNVEDPVRAWYSLAAIYASRNDAVRTEGSLRSAISAHPNWFKPHWMLAQLLQMQSHWKDAESEAVLALELNGGKNPEVLRTLAEIRAQARPPLQK